MNPKNLKYLYIAIATAIVVVMALVLHWQGRLWIYSGGYVKLWHGLVVSSENSQHLFDWYTFTHFIHGLGFYLLLWLVDRKKKLSFAAKFLVAVGLEAAWEILENSAWIIDRYRTATISLDYYGDSVINSIGDIIAMAVGFYFAYKTKIWLSILAFIVLEIALAFVIRDNLTLNIIMLLHPIEAIKTWQGS